MALPQANRLRHRRDFQAVYQRGIRRSGRYLTLRGLMRPVALGASSPKTPLIKTQNNKSSTQIGISISQKVSKKAVIRNRIKRQIRAAIKQLLPRLSPDWQLVVVVKLGAQECDYAQFLRELEQLLVAAEVLNGHKRGSDL
ncbi:ribonuclease P protein component [Lyngbya aestuarii]|uniref:ribonuclease P protein component n=1 Tax=Lyngbya aestuarii TaxID=118322 RepID=UPI00403D7846